MADLFVDRLLNILILLLLMVLRRAKARRFEISAPGLCEKLLRAGILGAVEVP